MVARDNRLIHQRNLRDLTLNARINWEVPWAQVPARDKAKLFEVVSLGPSVFENNWLTLVGEDRHATSIHIWVVFNGIGQRRK